MAAAHLIECGLSRLAYCGPPGRRLDAFVAAGREAGIRVSASPLLRDAFAVHETRWRTTDDALAPWLRTLGFPVGMFAFNDAIAQRVLWSCRRLALRVPDDLAVIGVDNDDLLCELGSPLLTSIEQPTSQIGYAAAGLLAQWLDTGKKPPPEPVLFPPVRVVPRESTDVLFVDDRQVADAVRFVRDNATRRIGVADVAAGISVSRRWLEQRFRQHLKHSVLEEIKRVRLRRACELLVTTDLPQARVAEASGFGTVGSLHMAFRESLHRTPATYRQQFRHRGLP